MYRQPYRTAPGARGQGELSIAGRCSAREQCDPTGQARRNPLLGRALSRALARRVGGTMTTGTGGGASPARPGDGRRLPTAAPAGRRRTRVALGPGRPSRVRPRGRLLLGSGPACGRDPRRLLGLADLSRAAFDRGGRRTSAFRPTPAGTFHRAKCRLWSDSRHAACAGSCVPTTKGTDSSATRCSCWGVPPALHGSSY